MSQNTELSYYEKIFKELGKEDLFKVNKPFLEELASLKAKIVAIRSDKDYVDLIKHPFNPSITRPSESSKYLLKLLNQYTDMTKVLNKILGVITSDEDDPLGKWMKSHGDSNNEN